jgi:hypothetical protein
MDMHKGSQEGVLKSVFRVFTIPGNAIGTPEKSFRVRMAQSIESGRVSAFCGGYQMEFRRSEEFVLSIDGLGYGSLINGHGFPRHREHLPSIATVLLDFEGSTPKALSCCALLSGPQGPR